MYLVVNNDEADNRYVAYEEALALSKEIDANFFEISVKNGTNCEALF